MTCPFCSADTIPGARYCHTCGGPLAPEANAPQTERRVVTVLFADLSDFTAWSEDQDPERVGAVTDLLLNECVQAVVELGGHVNKLTGDGLMAVFGAPLSHEDDAERAVRAAQAMQRRVRRRLKAESGGGLPIGLRVGLRTGLVVAGMQANLEYTVIGDTVNTAARISDVASVGAVYAGEQTVESTKHIASWRRLNPVKLKGKRLPVEVYELLGFHDEPGTRASLGDRAPFIGRDAELGRVKGRLEAVAERNQPQVLIHTAEAGMGKTRFARECRTLASERGARVLMVRSAAYGEGRRFGPLADLVRKAAGLKFIDDRATAEERLQRIADRHPDSSYLKIEVLLGLLGHVRTDVGESPGGFTGQAFDAGTVPTTVADLLNLLATEGPMVIIVDDVHSASHAALESLGVAVSQLRGPILTLLFARPELMRDAPQLGRLSEAEVYPLPPLVGADAARLLTAYLDGGSLDAEDETKLLAFAQGNPYYLAELVTLLTEQGHLTLTDRSWTLADGSLTGKVLSHDLAQVLGARIDALPADARALLRNASVFGDVIPEEAVDFLRDTTHGDVDAALEELLERRMLRRRTYSGYRFVTPLLRQAAYGPIGMGDAAHQHARISRWAAHVTLADEEADELVIFHAEQAIHLATTVDLNPEDDAWSVVPLVAQAARKQAQAAMYASEPEQAVAILDRAERVHPLGQADRLLRGRALVRLGEIPRAIDEVASLAGELKLQVPTEGRPVDTSLVAFDDAKTAAQILLLLGRIYRYRGAIDLARASWKAALEVAGIANLVGPRSDAQCRLGMLDYLSGDLDQADARFLDALSAATDADDQQRLGWALQHRAWVLTARGDFATAEKVLQRADDVFTGIKDTQGAAWVRGAAAFTLLMSGLFTDARRLADTFLPVGQRSGDLFAVGLLRSVGAAAAVELGDAEKADQQANMSYADFERIDDDWGRGFALYVRALAASRLKHIDNALVLAAEADRYAFKIGHPLLQRLTEALRGWCLLRQGFISDATDAAESILAATRAEVQTSSRGAPIVLLAEIAVAEGDTFSALEYLERLTPYADQPCLGWPRRRAIGRYAQLLDEDGQVEKARVWAEQTLSSFGEDPDMTEWAEEYLRTSPVAK